MPHNRYYFPEDLVVGQTAHLTDDEGHHLVRVLRSRVDDVVELVNGQGKLAEAEVKELERDGALLSILRIVQEQAPPPQLILALAIPRMTHLEWVIEKGTELNATAFWLFPGALSEKRSLGESQLMRLRALSIASLKQCGRLHLPEIVMKPPLSAWEALPGSLFFGDTHKGAPYFWQLSLTNPLPSPAIFFVGPEKGFDAKETDHLRKGLGAKGVRLHPNILRAETAPVAALAQIHQFLSN